ncbi:MAG TPA: hypothetical protein PKX91_01660 [Clostridia bacterium]|nr:hypothetical protein [Clostridia bacterium]
MKKRIFLTLLVCILIGSLMLALVGCSRLGETINQLENSENSSDSDTSNDNDNDGGSSEQEPGEEEHPIMSFENIINGLLRGNNFKITYTHTDISEDITVYKNGNNFLTEQYESAYEGNLYYYYKYNAGTWDKYFLGPLDEIWGDPKATGITASELLESPDHHTYPITPLDYLFHFNSKGADSYGYYYHRAELKGTESITISGKSYTCQKYEFATAYETLYFWIADISGIRFCLKYTHSNAYSNIEGEVIVFETTGYTFPSNPHEKGLP